MLQNLARRYRISNVFFRYLFSTRIYNILIILIYWLLFYTRNYEVNFIFFTKHKSCCKKVIYIANMNIQTRANFVLEKDKT